MTRRRVATAASASLVVALVAAAGVTASAASYTDQEWDTAEVAALDCTADGLGSSTASGRLLGGDLLSIDLDSVAELSGVRVDNDGTDATPDPLSADVVAGSDDEAYQNPLDVTALSAINLALGGLLVLPLDTPVGVVGQYARADAALSSTGAAGAVTDDGAIDLETEDDPFVEGDERPDLATLELGTLLESALGDTLADAVTGLTDLRLEIGALASVATLDGCSLAWDGDIAAAVDREYAIAGLDLDVDSPLVGDLVTAASGALDGVETAVNGLASDDGLLDSITTGVVGALAGVLGTIGVSSPTVDLAVTVDLSAATALLDDTISDDDGVLAIDLAAGTVTVDIEALFGAVYGSDGLNGLAPNTELLIDDDVLAALEDALTDAIANWVSDLTDAVTAALDAVTVEAAVTLPLAVEILSVDVTLGELVLEVDASLADLLSGDAVVSVTMNQEAGLCAIPVVGSIACGLVNTLVAALTDVVLDAVALSIGTAVQGALTTIGATFESTLDTALDAPVAALLALLDGTLGFLFDEDTGVLSILVNAQNDPTDVGAGPEPTDWAGFPVADPPASTGRYDVDALRITVLGVLDPLEVTLDLARSSVGSNVLG